MKILFKGQPVPRWVLDGYRQSDGEKVDLVVVSGFAFAWQTSRQPSYKTKVITFGKFETKPVGVDPEDPRRYIFEGAPTCWESASNFLRWRKW